MLDASRSALGRIGPRAISFFLFPVNLLLPGGTKQQIKEYPGEKDLSSPKPQQTGSEDGVGGWSCCTWISALCFTQTCSTCFMPLGTNTQERLEGWSMTLPFPAQACMCVHTPDQGFSSRLQLCVQGSHE